LERIEKKEKLSLFSEDRIAEYERTKRDGLLKLIGQMTAVDGATIITKEFDLIGFGGKIKAANSDVKPGTIAVREPFANGVEETISLSAFGGTRHQSAAQFVFDQRDDSVAIVASQDGRISVIYWDKIANMVKAVQHAEYAFV